MDSERGWNIIGTVGLSVGGNCVMAELRREGELANSSFCACSRRTLCLQLQARGRMSYNLHMCLY